MAPAVEVTTALGYTVEGNPHFEDGPWYGKGQTWIVLVAILAILAIAGYFIYKRRNRTLGEKVEDLAEGVKDKINPSPLDKLKHKMTSCVD